MFFHQENSCFRLQQSVATSTVSKKIVYVVVAVVIVLCLVAIITGTVVALTGSSCKHYNFDTIDYV